MRRFNFLLMFIIASMWQWTAAAVQDTSDLFWSKQVGSDIARVKFIPDLSGNPLSKGLIAVGNGTEVLIYDVLTSNLITQYNTLISELKNINSQ